MNLDNLEKSINWNALELPVTVGETLADEYKAIVNSSSKKVLYIPKQSYTVYPNDKIMESVEKLAEMTKGEVIGYQSFKDGKKVLGYVKPSENIKRIGNFDIQDYIVIGNSHDGTTGTFVGTTTELLRCQNQFSKIMKANIVYHNNNNILNIDSLLASYLIEQQNLYKTFEKMSTVKIDKTIIEALKQRIFNVENMEEISTRKQNQMFQFDESIEREMTDLGSNMWGFFNAATHYSTHTIVQRSSTVGNVLGTSADFNNKSMSAIEEKMKEMNLVLA